MGPAFTMSPPVIGRYEIRRGLGRGAMGSVYLAFDTQVGREVAIKVLDRKIAQNEKHRMRFDREARAIGALHHPNIVEIYDYGGSPDQYLYLVMELIRGPDTGSLCREHGPFPESVVAAVGCELAAALAHAHQAGIIHRDIKPENVFLDRGRLVLADFGIAKAIVADNPLGPAAASPKTDVVGTPGFMAPEQLLGQPLDGRSDLFALGALLYYLGSRQLPYPAESPYELMKEFRATRPPPLGKLRPDFSDATSLLVQACLEVNKEQRPARAEVVRRELRRVLDELGAPDVREVLATYEAAPMAFRAADRERGVHHLVQRLKVAVRDQDGVAVDTLRKRLGSIDPPSAQALRITGIEGFAQPSAHDTAPELHVARQTRRRLVWALVAVALLAGAAVVWWTLRPQPAPGAAAHGAAFIEVRAGEPTSAYLDGRALGQGPPFVPVSVPAGGALLEVVGARGRLSRRVELVPGAKLVAEVDWQKRRLVTSYSRLPAREPSLEATPHRPR